VQGYLSYTQVLDEATILDVAIHPDDQGQGLGRILLSGSLQQMLSLGVQRCLLEVRETNLAARALYAKLDFQLDGQRKNYYPAQNGRENALLMSRQL
jgi:ribosomal-protein-alanine N-acetyltransferase